MARSLNPLDEPQRLRWLGSFVVLALVLGMFVSVEVIAADVEHLDVVNRLVAGEDVAYEEVVASDDRVRTSTDANLLMLVVTAVVWIVWFRRAYRNLPRLGAGEQRFRPGWAVGGWFVPVLLYFRPKQIADEIWRASDPDPPPSTRIEDRPVSPLLHVWWGAWVILGLVDTVGARTLFQAETIADQRNAARLTLVSDSVWLALGLVAVVVVLMMTSRYERRREQVLHRAAGAVAAFLNPALRRR